MSRSARSSGQAPQAAARASRGCLRIPNALAPAAVAPAATLVFRNRLRFIVGSLLEVQVTPAFVAGHDGEASSGEQHAILTLARDHDVDRPGHEVGEVGGGYGERAVVDGVGGDDGPEGVDDPDHDPGCRLRTRSR